MLTYKAKLKGLMKSGQKSEISGGEELIACTEVVFTTGI